MAASLSNQLVIKVVSQQACRILPLTEPLATSYCENFVLDKMQPDNSGHIVFVKMAAYSVLYHILQVGPSLPLE